MNSHKRKIILQMMVSIDGYIAGPNDDLSWHLVDDEFNKYAIEQLQTFDTILFGRKTYQLFESFWPKALVDPKTSPDDRVIAKMIDDINKEVFSKSLDSVSWKNTKLHASVNEVQNLKNQMGKDMVIFGGAGLAQSLMTKNLIDEYRLMINPIILGKGKALFLDNSARITLELVENKEFKSGVVLLRYQSLSQ